MEEKSSKIGVLYAFAAYIAWGLLPIYWKTLQGVPAREILAHRIVWSFAFVAILILLKKQWGRIGIVLRDRSKLFGLLLSALLITANWYIYIWAVNSNKVVEASLGYYFNPLLVVLMGIIVLGERIDRWQIVSLILAAIGVLILTLEYGKIPWISLGLAVTFALYGLAKRLVNVDSLLGLALETAVVTPIALIYLLVGVNGGGVIGGTGVSTMLLLMGTGIITAFPLLWFANAAKSVPFATIGFIQYVSPTINLLLGVFVYHEEFTATHAWSFGFIWVALAVYSISRIFFLRRANLRAAHTLQGK
ncbi:EamA family transporter RarD [Desulfitobacterium sp. THU1]|uniref:EamA family transporter RarD n=1 Tax=Desulfitobacterium sp. THU1 TaxID=3138072 RepID=UPI00311F9DDD